MVLANRNIYNAPITTKRS